MALSIVKKSTLVGSFFCNDKKYFLKEFLFVAAYGISCLNINHTILWPLSLSVVLFVGSFIVFDVFLKKVESRIRDMYENKVNV